jgi:hypothetical protein
VRDREREIEREKEGERERERGGEREYLRHHSHLLLVVEHMHNGKTIK